VAPFQVVMLYPVCCTSLDRQSCGGANVRQAALGYLLLNRSCLLSQLVGTTPMAASPSVAQECAP
jgi:hypothetical protein